MTNDEKLMQQALDWMDRNGEVVFSNSGLSAVLSMNLVAEALRARLAQPEPEPWAGVDFDIKTAPPQREFIGLTDEEIEELWGEPVDCMYSGTYAGIRAIEAKLREKNDA